MKIIVINLDQSIDRLKKIDNNLRKHNLCYERFSAIYGKNLSDEEIKKNSTPSCRNLLCNHGMIGCALSHMKIWEEYKNESFILVIEDDSEVNENIKLLIDNIDEIYKKLNFDIINLYCGGICSKKIGTEKITVGEFTFIKPFFPLSTACYILSNKGIMKLLNMMDKVVYHLDFNIMLIKDKLEYYALDSPRVVDNKEYNSTMASQNKSIVLNGLNLIGFPKTTWTLNVPMFTINLKFTISIYQTLLLIFILISMIIKAYPALILFLIEFLLTCLN